MKCKAEGGDNKRISLDDMGQLVGLHRSTTNSFNLREVIGQRTLSVPPPLHPLPTAGRITLKQDNEVALTQPPDRSTEAGSWLRASPPLSGSRRRLYVRGVE